jgi:hypothetical protein
LQKTHAILSNKQIEALLLALDITCEPSEVIKDILKTKHQEVACNTLTTTPLQLQ